VDASGVETGLNQVNRAIEKTAADLGRVGAGANFGAGIESEAQEAAGGLDKVSQGALEAEQSVKKLAGANLQALGSQLDGLSSKMQSWGTSLTLIAAPFEIAAAAGIAAFANSVERPANPTALFAYPKFWNRNQNLRMD